MIILSDFWSFRHWVHGCGISYANFSVSSPELRVFMRHWQEISILSICCSDLVSDTGQMDVIND